METELTKSAKLDRNISIPKSLGQANISPSNINNNFNLDIPKLASIPSNIPTGAQLNAPAVVGATDYEANKLKSEIDAENARASSLESSSFNDFTNSLSALGNRESDTVKAEEAVGIPALSQELAGVKGLIDTNSALAENQKLLQAQSAGGTKSQLQAINSDIDYRTAIANNTALAQANILIGKIGVANEAVKRAITAKYAPLEANLERTKAIYNRNADLLKTLDNRKFQLALSNISREEKRLEKEKEQEIENEKNKLVVLADVNNNNAPQDIKDKVANAKTYKEALIVAGSYGNKDKLANMLTLEKIKSEQANRAKIYADIEKTKAGTGAGAGAGGIAGNISSQAKAYIDQVRRGELSIEQLYTKLGSSKEAFKLKNEIALGLQEIGGVVSNTARAEAENAINIIESIKPSYFGFFDTEAGFLASTADPTTKSRIDQLKSLLSLEARNKLQGSGAISDFEAKTLEKSATLLSNARISEDTAKEELQRLKGVFQNVLNKGEGNTPTATNKALQFMQTKKEVEQELNKTKGFTFSKG